MNERNDKFSYTYAAPTEGERREIEEIRKQYCADEGEEDKLSRLRRLNARVKNTAMCAALSCGVSGVLIFGLGMSLTLAFGQFAAGIVVAVVGVIPMVLANPLYNFVLKKCKAKYGEEILRLSDELLNGRK